MQTQNLPGRWLIAPALLLAFCSQGPSSPTRPSVPSAAASSGSGGTVGASADGDVKVGAGVLEIVRLRMDRQTSSGVSVLRQYANPGQTYAMNPGETIELWAEYPAAVPNPRFKVEWGDGEADITGCGSCLLKHAYPEAGIFTVKASLDDRISTTVTRTFRLESSAPSPTSSGPTGTVRLTGGGTVPVQYFPCGTGVPGTCTAAAARTTCQSAGLKVVSHASDGSATVASLGAAASCQWSISYFTVNTSMPAGACLVGVSNLDWSSCCTLSNWHGNTVGFGAPGAIFGYVNSGNSGYVPANPNVSGQTWGCVALSTPAGNLGGCTQQYVACTP